MLSDFGSKSRSWPSGTGWVPRLRGHQGSIMLLSLAIISFLIISVSQINKIDHDQRLFRDPIEVGDPHSSPLDIDIWAKKADESKINQRSVRYSGKIKTKLCTIRGKDSQDKSPPFAGTSLIV